MLQLPEVAKSLSGVEKVHFRRLNENANCRYWRRHVDCENRANVPVYCNGRRYIIPTNPEDWAYICTGCWIYSKNTIRKWHWRILSWHLSWRQPGNWTTICRKTVKATRTKSITNSLTPIISQRYWTHTAGNKTGLYIKRIRHCRSRKRNWRRRKNGIITANRRPM